jgi:hypothetical protein
MEQETISVYFEPLLTTYSGETAGSLASDLGLGFYHETLVYTDSR